MAKTSSKVMGVLSTEFRDAVPNLLALLAVENQNSNALFQCTFQSQCKLLIMFILSLIGGAPGYQVFPKLSPCTGHFDLYLGWAPSVSSTGIVPKIGQNKRVSAAFCDALKKGKWLAELYLYKYAKAWEQMLSCKSYLLNRLIN